MAPPDLRVARAAPTTFAAAMAPTAAQLCALRGELRAWLLDVGATTREAGEVLIAVGEACANAIEHARAPAGSAIDVDGRLTGGAIALRVRDRGRWRTGASEPDRGRGLALMRMLMDECAVVSGPEGTSVELRRALAAPAAPAERYSSVAPPS